MLFSSSLFAQQTEVTINIGGLISSQGKVFIALFNSSKGFPNEGQTAFYKKVLDIKDKQASITLLLAKGTYALAVFHDENDNQKMDKNMVGYPKEKFGFSNDPKIAFSAPSFEECSFLVTESPKQIMINLK
jgi:uncharacterized protein (DUF2141 family)